MPVTAVALTTGPYAWAPMSGRAPPAAETTATKTSEAAMARAAILRWVLPLALIREWSTLALRRRRRAPLANVLDPVCFHGMLRLFRLCCRPVCSGEKARLAPGFAFGGRAAAAVSPRRCGPWLAAKPRNCGATPV